MPELDGAVPDIREAKRLHAIWKATRARQVRESVLPPYYSSEATDYAEQQAYDALIDVVEANDLNHSVYDPRTGE